MATYNYVKTDGSLGTVVAPDSQSAIASLPGDAKGDSGVWLNSSSPVAAPIAPTPASPTPAAPKTSPSAPQAPTTSPVAPPATPSGFGLPAFQASKSTSSLLEFANGLDQAVTMAQKKRNAAFLGNVMMPGQGTMMASDFNGILGNMNRASANYSGTLTNRAIELNTPQFSYGTASDNQGNLYQVQYDAQGKMIGQQLLSQAAPAATKTTPYTEVSPGATLYDTTTGQVVYTAPTAASQKPAASQPSSPSGGLTMSSQQISQLKEALNNSKFQGPEADGKYVDPNLYLQNYQSWLQAGGSAEEFFRIFPPATYINPANTWMPEEIMRFVKKPAASSNSNSLEDDIDSLFN